MHKILHPKTLLMLGVIVFGFLTLVSTINTPKASAFGVEATPAEIFCSQYTDEDVNLACASGYELGNSECDRFKDKKFQQACDKGAAASDLAQPGASKDLNKQKAEKAQQAEKESKKAVKTAQKSVDKQQKAVKKACAKDKNSKACKNAQKDLDKAKAKLTAAKKKADGATRAAAALSSVISTGGCKSKTFFGLNPWYAYLGDEFSSANAGVNQGDPCTLKCFNFLPQEKPNACGVKHSDIPYVLLAVVDALLRVSGLVAVIFVIVGATKYITSQGEPEAVATAQSTILNALIGMAIALVAIALITFATRNIGA